MGSNPINLLFRFLLELSALLSMGVWGWRQDAGALRFVIALGVPALAATLWGVLAVPHDPSRSGSAPVPVPGAIRLLLEMLFFAFAVWALHQTHGTSWAAWFAGAIVLHYAASYDRIRWLITRRPQFVAR